MAKALCRIRSSGAISQVLPPILRDGSYLTNGLTRACLHVYVSEA
jgi:hypothetical protein